MPSPLLLVAPAVAFAAKSGSLKDLDKHNGFRDLAFTQRCDEVADFKGNKLVVKKAATVRTDKDPYAGMIVYRRPDEQLRIGETELLDISYTCYMDQLYSVKLEAWGPEDAEQLLYTLSTAFGEAPKKDEDIGFWQWDANKVILTMRHDKDTDTVTAVFTSKPMLKAKRENDELIRRSAVNDI
jgi:hypothetical protein